MNAPPMPRELLTMALNLPCDRCQARVGEPCRGATRHLARIIPIWVIYKIGYRQGRRDMKKEIESANSRDQV